MISVDTNVLVRLLTGDDKIQSKKAFDLFHNESIFITKTVMLETEWVLRFAYKFSANDIVGAFQKLLGQVNVAVEDNQHIATAIRLLNDGMDFADALHLSCSRNVAFATFDKKLAQCAQHAGLNNIYLL